MDQATPPTPPALPSAAPARGKRRLPPGRPRKLPTGVSRRILSDGRVKYLGWRSEDGKKEYYPLRATVEEALLDRATSMQVAEDIPANPLTIGEGIEKVKQRLQDQNRREGTRSWFAKYAGKVQDHFGPGALLEAIDREQVEGFRDALVKAGTKAATLAHARRALSMILRGNAESLHGDPMHGVAWPQVEAKEMRFLRAAEVAQIVQRIRGWEKSPVADRDADLVAFAFLSGLRRSELARLRGEDVDLKSTPPRVFVTGKRGNVPVPLTAESAAIVARMVERVGGKGPLIEAGATGVTKVFARWKARLDEKRLSPHALRHGFVTELVGSGMALGTVRSLARHASAATTMKYLHATQDAAQALAVLSLEKKPEPAKAKPAARAKRAAKRKKKPKAKKGGRAVVQLRKLG